MKRSPIVFNSYESSRAPLLDRQAKPFQIQLRFLGDDQLVGGFHAEFGADRIERDEEAADEEIFVTKKFEQTRASRDGIQPEHVSQADDPEAHRRKITFFVNPQAGAFDQLHERILSEQMEMA